MFTSNRWMSNPGRALRAFTLIELLVVVAIISLLAAILFPVFARARENARRASCLSNIKQMGLAMMQYVQDYDETYPVAYYYGYAGTTMPDGQIWFGSTTYPGVAWPQILYPYHKSVQMFWCPSSNASFNSVAGVPVPADGQYGANTSILQFPWIPVVKLSAINSAASTYLFMDEGNIAATYTDAVPGTADVYYIPGMNSTTCDSIFTAAFKDDCKNGRHFGGVNVGFADGHAKWLKSSTVVEQARLMSVGSPSAWNPASELN